MGYEYGNIESKNLFERIKKTKKVYVETGTYYGGGIDYGLNHFDYHSKYKATKIFHSGYIHVYNFINITSILII